MTREKTVATQLGWSPLRHEGHDTQSSFLQVERDTARQAESLRRIAK